MRIVVALLLMAVGTELGPDELVFRSVTRRPAVATKCVGAAYATNVLFTFLTTLPASVAGECTGAPVAGDNCEATAFARASNATCTRSDGIVVSLPNNAPRVNSSGFISEAGATNLILRSRDFSQGAWTKSNATCTLTATGTDGMASSASTCTATASNATVLQAVTASGARNSSVYLRRNTGSGSVYATRDGGTTWIDVSASVTGSWVRVSKLLYSGLQTSGTNPSVGIKLATTGDAVDVDRAQDEAGVLPTSAIDTAGTSAARIADKLTAPNPLKSTDSAWCMAATVNLPASPYNAGVGQNLFCLGPTYGAANSALLYTQANGTLAFYLYDNAAAGHYYIGTVAVPSGSHRIRACSVSGTMTVRVDGTLLASPATSGATTGTITTPQTPFVIGNSSITTTAFGPAPISNVCIGNASGACI